MYSLKYLVVVAMATLLSATTTSAAPMHPQAVNITLPPLTRPAINVTLPVNITIPPNVQLKNQSLPINITVSGHDNDITVSVDSSWFSWGRKNRRSQPSRLH